jgi:hypothetical protein
MGGMISEASGHKYLDSGAPWMFDLVGVQILISGEVLKR